MSYKAYILERTVHVAMRRKICQAWIPDYVIRDDGSLRSIDMLKILYNSRVILVEVWQYWPRNRVLNRYSRIRSLPYLIERSTVIDGAALDTKGGLSYLTR